MAGFKLNIVVFMAMMVASMQFHGTVAQTRHVVGDALGWTVPPSGAVAYTTWASLQTFTVGDILVFNFTTGQHNVAEVSQAAYSPCTSTNPVSLATTGPATLNLTTPGTHYYICTVGTHCQIGQKLTINVAAAAATTPPPATATLTPPPTTTPSAPSPTPPPRSSPSSPPTIATPPSTSGVPSPTGSTTPPPPPPSSAAPSFTAGVPATFLAIALAFLNY